MNIDDLSLCAAAGVASGTVARPLGAGENSVADGFGQQPGQWCRDARAQ